jgi:hypothetical protein
VLLGSGGLLVAYYFNDGSGQERYIASSKADLVQ